MNAIRNLLALSLGLLLAATATAQAWPSKPVRIIVPFAAGGPADNYARVLLVGLRVGGRAQRAAARPGRS